MGGQDAAGAQVVDGDIEEALDGRGMQIDGQHAVGARRGDEVGDQLGRDRLAPRRLLLLLGVAIVGDRPR